MLLHYWLDWSWKHFVDSVQSRLKLKTTCSFIFGCLKIDTTCSFILDSFEPVKNLLLHYWLDLSWKQLVASFQTRLKLKTTCRFIFGCLKLESTCSFILDSFETGSNLLLHYWLDWSWKQLVASFQTRLKLKTTCSFIFGCLKLESTFSFILDSFKNVNNLLLHYWLDWSWKQLVASFQTRLKLKTTCSFIFGCIKLEWTCSFILDSFEPGNDLLLHYWLVWSWKQLVASFQSRLMLKTTCSFISVV